MKESKEDIGSVLQNRGIIIGQNWESYHNDMRIYRHIQSFKTRQKSGFIDPSIDLFLKILRGVFFVKDKKHFYLKRCTKTIN